MSQAIRRSNHAHLLVCRSCGEACRFSDSDATEHERTSLAIKHFLEEQLLNEPEQSWSVRVVESSCLDVCPRGAVSVRLVGAKNSEHSSLTWTVASQHQLEQLLSLIKTHIERNVPLRGI
jgi:predicted metal-binding protein